MNPDQIPKAPNQDIDPPELKPFSPDLPPHPLYQTPISAPVEQLPSDIDSRFDTPEPVQLPGATQLGSDELPPPDPLPNDRVFSTAKPRRFSKKSLLLITAASILVVLGAAGSAYAFWYNKPDRALTDTFSRTLAAQYGTVDGSFGYKSDEAKMDANLAYTSSVNTSGESSFDGKLAVKSDGKSYDLNISAVASKDRKLFVKMEPLKKLVDAIAQGQSSMFDGLIAKLDGKWLVITPKDVNNDAEADKQTACAENVLRSFITNKKQQQEVAKLYEKHRFIVITKDYGVTKLGGALANHYDVKYDEKLATAFGDAVVDTDVFKKVDECYKGELRKAHDEEEKSRSENTGSSQTDTSKSATKTELWIDALTHAPLKLSITNTDTTTSTFVANFHLGKNVPVTVPKATVTVDDLKAEIEKIQNGIFDTSSDTTTGSGNIQAKARDTERQTDVNALRMHLEAYYAENGSYPASPKLSMFPGADGAVIAPPLSSVTSLNIVSVVPLSKPMIGNQEAYAYLATDASGKPCSSTECSEFTLYWWKESTGTIQSKSSLN